MVEICNYYFLLEPFDQINDCSCVTLLSQSCHSHTGGIILSEMSLLLASTTKYYNTQNGLGTVHALHTSLLFNVFCIESGSLARINDNRFQRIIKETSVMKLRCVEFVDQLLSNEWMFSVASYNVASSCSR